MLVLCASRLMLSHAHAKTIKPDQPVDPNMGVLLAGVTSDTYGMVDVWYYYRKKGTQDKNPLEAFGFNLIGRPDDDNDDEEKKVA
ncbi:MAG: hypothetical protein HGB15_10200 [Chlorobaculum sp.]|nr:hypothetical protein [Chlorobaculum sp.]